MEDSELLRQYADDHSDEAFAELVRRHFNLVYSAALRQVGGDAHHAKDVAQVVFTAIALNADSLKRHPLLSGWLYTTTRYSAAKLVRSEQRRQAREREAHTMDELTPGSEPSVEWPNIRPVLDDAMHDLNDRDREAVLLRFFESRPFGEIGSRLGVTADTAQKRVERALEKLREQLARRGVTSTAAALAAALAGESVTAAPAGLALSTAGSALAAAATKLNALSLLKIMSMTKLKIGIVSTLIVAGGVGVTLQQRTHSALRKDLTALQDQVRENARARDENQRRLSEVTAENAGLRQEHDELIRLRGEAAALKTQLATAVDRKNSAAPSPTVTSAGASRVVSMDDMGNAGHATVRAAGQTIAWAVQHADVDLASSLITFSPESRARLQPAVAELPENLRAQYDTPEKLMAFVMAGTPRPVATVQVLDENPTGPDDVTQHVQLTYADGRARTDELQFHHDNDGWRQVMTPASVDRLLAFLKRGSLPAAK